MLIADDIWDIQDPYYEALRKRLFEIADGTVPTRNSRGDVRDAAQGVVKCEAALKRGLAVILSRACRFPNEMVELAETAYWFGRADRWTVLAYFGKYSAVTVEAPTCYSIASCQFTPFQFPREFYEIKDVATAPATLSGRDVWGPRSLILGAAKRLSRSFRLIYY